MMVLTFRSLFGKGPVITKGFGSTTNGNIGTGTIITMGIIMVDMIIIMAAADTMAEEITTVGIIMAAAITAAGITKKLCSF